MPKDFTVTVTNPERAAQWREMIGSDTVCVQSPIPEPADLPGHPHALIYLVDLHELNPGQIARLVESLSRRFGLSPEEANRELQERGIPILADDCIVTVAHPQRWLT